MNKHKKEKEREKEKEKEKEEAKSEPTIEQLSHESERGYIRKNERVTYLDE
jgi:hypothetical protein